MLKRTKVINTQTNKNKSMQITKSKFLGLFIATILLTSLISYVAFSNPSISYTTVIQEGSMNSEASFIIFQDDGTYYSRNGQTGVVSSSSNFSNLLITAIEATPFGQLIIIKNSDDPYIADTGILIETPVHIRGEGISYGGSNQGKKGTVIQFDSITNATEIYLFEFYQSDYTKHLYFASIEDICLDANRAENDKSWPLYIHGQVSDLFFEKVWFKEGGYGGIRIYATTDEAVWNLWFRDCLIENNDGAGISISTSTPALPIQRIHILDAHFYDNWDDIVTWGDAGEIRDIIIRGCTSELTDRNGFVFEEGEGITVVQNHIIDAGAASSDTYDAIYVENANNITIVANELGNYDTSNTRYGINLNGTCSEVKIAFNNIGECVSGEIHVGPNVGMLNIQGNADEWISPYVQYLPLAFRTDQQGLIYYEDPYIICRIHTEVNHTISWLAFGKTFGYGTYEWKAKVSGMEQDDSSFYMGLEKRHGWAIEGIIAVRYEPAAAEYQLYTSDGANAESTEITGVTFTNENTFMIVWNSSHVLLYVNDVLKATHETYTPSGQMQLFGEAITYATAPSAEVYLYFKNRSFREVDT